MADELTPTPLNQAQPLQAQQSIASYIYTGLMRRGFNPAQAAALTGNIQQESNFNPAAPNEKEGGIGLLQWREERRTNLDQFAAFKGTSPTNLDTQLDFITHEMLGSERENSSAFLQSNDVQSANAALHSYIRYGDDTQPTRLAYANRFASGDFSGVMMPQGGAYGSSTPEPTLLSTTLDFGQDLAKAKAASAPAAAGAPATKPFQLPRVPMQQVTPTPIQPPQPIQARRPLDIYNALLKRQPLESGSV